MSPASETTAAITAHAGAPSTRSKIKTLADLAAILTGHRANGSRVVLCHGVFDLLHVGHIRHFESAKQHGDILVVTLTPDRFVNKGPHRPAFSEALRAESLAALSCIDYVAINDQPMSIELIGLLKPHFYVKGADYKDADKDVTGGITLEQKAVESVGGKIVFTDDIVFSSSTLINKHVPVFSSEVTSYLDGFTRRYSSDDVLRYLELMRPLKVLAVGEAIIDEYTYCQAIGKSSKEPIIAVKETSSERFAGGILAVANNVSAFSDNVGLVSLVGDRDTHDDFVKSSLRDTIYSHLLVRSNSPTIAKKRFIEDYFFTKMFEVYTINDAPLDRSDNMKLCALLEEVVPQYDVVVVVDFGHSMMTTEAARVVAEKAKFLAVNTQSNAGNLGYQTIFKYPKADYVCITQDEARLEMRDRSSDLNEIVAKLSDDLSCSKVVVTRGKSGSIAYRAGQGFVETPALAGHVVDRMGAGDAYLSVTSMLAALDAPMEILSFIGNAVGAQAVATIGHRESISRAGLWKFLTSLLK